jgi:hypothetical protein
MSSESIRSSTRSDGPPPKLPVSESIQVPTTLIVGSTQLEADTLAVEKAPTPHSQYPPPQGSHISVPSLNMPICDIPESNTVNVIPVEPLTLTNAQERSAVYCFSYCHIQCAHAVIVSKLC